MAKQIVVDPLSCVSLHLQCFLQGALIGEGTGFVVIHNATNCLITNWHVITGRDPNTGEPLSATGAADPDMIAIWHHDAKRLGSWHQIAEPLIDPSSGNRLWREHPLGRQIDVVALALKPNDTWQPVFPLPECISTLTVPHQSARPAAPPFP